MMQECSEKRAVRGLAFSDSFHTIKSRLDVIYSRRPEGHRIAVFAVAILLVLAASFVYASRHPAFVFDGTFDIYVEYYDADQMVLAVCKRICYTALYECRAAWWRSVPLQQESPEYRAVNATYSYEDGWLVVDKVALYAYLEPHN